MSETNVVIIGAGPAGLCISHYLNKYSIENIVLEKNRVGSSWNNMPDFFILVTPNWTNKLPGKPNASLFRTPSCNDYGRYLQQFAQHNNINVLENNKCEKVTQLESGKFSIKHEGGTTLASHVVMACGYFSAPNQPEEIDIRINERVAHSSTITTIDDISSAQRLLIVGKRESAGQIAGAFLKKTKGNATLSFDGELVLRKNHTLYGKLREKLYFLYEPIKCAIHGRQDQDSFPPMDTAHIYQFLNSPRLEIRPRLKSWDGKKAVFNDGSSDEFDFVVLATGYTYSGEAMVDCADGQKLFYIGKDNQTDFRSRYLRGIRRDAKKVALSIVESAATL